MSERIFIIHGWGGNPEEGWFPWLKRELEARGFQVFVPQLPDPENPRILNWVRKLAETVGTPDEQTYFVGHSLGCQTIARYLESLPENIKVGGVIFVAGFFKRLNGLGDNQETNDIANYWLNTPLDFLNIKNHFNKSVAIFSDNDPIVPLDNRDDFRDKLSSKIIVEHAKGHFAPDDGIIELPSALQSILEITQ